MIGKTNKHLKLSYLVIMSITSAHFIILSLIYNFAYTKQHLRVVGGEYATIAEYPHSVLLVLNCTEESSLCGASILNQKILLSAAHCFQNCNIQPPSKDRIVAFFGSTYMSNMQIQRRIDKVADHEGWSEYTGENDIAVVSLLRYIPLGSNLKRVVITKDFPHITKYSEAFVAGWGVHIGTKNDRHNQYIEDHLRQTYQKLRSMSSCTRYGRLFEGMFCAGAMHSDEDYPAAGDSGSALVLRNKYHQIGVVSFGWVLYPAMTIYTNVSYYYNWIHDNARKIYCDNNDTSNGTVEFYESKNDSIDKDDFDK